MAKNINQIPTQATSILPTDKMYLGRSPFGVTDDRYILGSDIIAQLASPLTTKGDLYTFTTVDARLPVGTVDGQILQVNAAAASGLAWSTTSYPATTTINQILYSSAANTVSGIPTANNGVLITSAGGVPSISSTLPTAVQDNITRLGTIVSGVWNGTAVTVPYGGTGATTFTEYMPVCGGTTATGSLQSVSAVGAVAGYALTYTSAATLPTWQAVGAAYTPSALTRVDDTNVTLTLGGTPTTALLQAVSLTLGWTGTLSGTRGGTGVNNGSNTITIAGNLNFADAFTTSGGFAVTQTYTGITNVTFPTSGTLATTSQLPTPAALTRVDDTNVTLTLGGTPSTALLQATSLTLGWSGQLSLSRGGSNADLSAQASNGGIVWSNATQMQILAGTATARQMLQSGSTATPSWSTTTWPATSTAGRLLYSTFNNVIDELTTTASAVLTSNGSSVPTWTAGGSAGDVLTFNGTIWTSAAPADANVTITDDTTTNATMYPTWVTANTGALPLKVTSTKLYYNPSTSLLTNIGALGQITNIQSSAGESVLSFSYVASAVNYFTLQNSDTGNAISMTATGTDSSIAFNFRSKNANFNFYDVSSTIAPAIRLYNAANNQYTGLKVATSASSTVTFTLPSADAAGFMISDGSANLSLSGTPSDISGSVTVNGFSSVSTNTFTQLKIGKMVFVRFIISGTSNATTFTVTNMPTAAQTSQAWPIVVTNSGTNAFGLAAFNASTTLTFYNNGGTSASSWTNSGTKSAYGSFWYEAS